MAKPSRIEIDPYDPLSLIQYAAKTAVLYHLGSYSALGEWQSSARPASGPKKVRYQGLQAPDLAMLTSIDDAISRKKGRPADDLAKLYKDLSGAVDGRTTGDPSVMAALFDSLTSSGSSRTRAEAILRGRCMVAWIEAHPSRSDIDLDEPLRGLGDVPTTVAPTHRGRIRDLIEELAAVVALPYHDGAHEAAALVGQTGTLAVEVIRQHIEKSPVGWTCVRCLTEMFRYARDPTSPLSLDERSHITTEAGELLRSIHRENPPNMARARSFWEEAASAVPRPPQYDDAWVIQALVDRVGWNGEEGKPKLPIRERLTAAMVTLRRSTADYSLPPQMRAPLEAVVQQLLESSRPTASHRNAETALTFCAAQIQHALDTGSSQVSVSFSNPGEPFSIVNKPTLWHNRRELECVGGVLASSQVYDLIGPVPSPSIPGALSLVATAALTPDGILRRTLLETLHASGIGRHASRLLQAVADSASQDRSLRWLQEHTTFCVAYLATPDGSSFPWLQRAAFPTEPGRSGRAIRVAAIMGLASMSPQIRRSDPELANQLARMIATELLIDESTVAEQRSSLYALALLQADDPDARRLVKRTRKFHPDAVARQLADWADRRWSAHRHADEHGMERSRLISPIAAAPGLVTSPV